MHVGLAFDPTALADRLVSQGYTRVPRVMVRGEFTLCGEVLDIFMPSEDYAQRIVFDFDRIESIRSFDCETQTSLGKTDGLLIYPMKETVWTDELILKVKKVSIRFTAVLIFGLLHIIFCFMQS